jgi:tetratricopeptide (TPR) repeat protein
MPYRTSRSLIILLLVVSLYLPAQQTFDPFNGISSPENRGRQQSISGIVYDTSGNRVAGASIMIRDLNTGELVAQGVTGHDGAFMATVRAGSFEITTSKDTEQERTIVRADQSAFLNITLKGSQTATASNAAVSLVDLKAPQKAQDEFEKAQEAIGKKDLLKARKHLEAAIKRYPDYAAALALLAFATMPSDLASAQTMAARAVQLAPEVGFNHAMLAATRNASQQFASALPESEIAVTLSPQLWQGHFERARALAGVGRLEDALKSATRADELSGGRILVARIARSRLLAALGRQQEANDQLNAFIQTAPDRTTREQAAAEKLSIMSFVKK